MPTRRFCDPYFSPSLLFCIPSAEAMPKIEGVLQKRGDDSIGLWRERCQHTQHLFNPFSPSPVPRCRFFELDGDRLAWWDNQRYRDENSKPPKVVTELSLQPLFLSQHLL